MKMAFQWSSDSIVAEHKELQANAMALDPKGQFALLAGRRCIAVIDLDRPTEVLKRLNRSQQKYNVTALEWNPTERSRNTFAMAVGERADLFQWRDCSLSEDVSLKAHTRTITDLNWHRSEPSVLVTCSIDTFLHIWDTREARKPVLSLSAIAGASQVKWNKLNPDYLASGHDCDIRIWDRRKTSQPISYINAHLSKIHCLDWSPNHETQIVSSSSDSTVKFFDITNPRKSEIFFNTQSPVWRARYTPFGESLLTVIIPPLRRGENSLLLWTMTDTKCPVHSFVGHSDIVLEFDWRFKDFYHSPGYQLVTWSRDNSLRMWKVDPHLLKICGHPIGDEECFVDDVILEASDTETILGCENGDSHSGGHSLCVLNESNDSPSNGELSDALAFLDKSQKERTDAEALMIPVSTNDQMKSLQLSDSALEPVSRSPGTPINAELPNLNYAMSFAPYAVSPAPSPASNSFLQEKSQNLHHEFVSLKSSFEGVADIVTDAEKRTCQVTVRRGSFCAILVLNFPTKYPMGICPNFRFASGTNIDGNVRAELLRVLKSTALQYTSIKKKKGCLEPCVRIFVNQLKALLTEERANMMDLGALHANNYLGQLYGGQQDYSIPFPRTSGARFNTAGFLVCFTRPTMLYQGSVSRERSTPRSLSALGAYVSSFVPQLPSSSATSPQYNYLYAGGGQSPSTEQNISISMYYYQDRKSKSKRGKQEDVGKSNRVGSIYIYDVSKLVPFSRDIASSYVLNDYDPIDSCLKNQDVAALSGRKDLSQAWSLIGSSLSMNMSATEVNEDFPWVHHPLGRKMVMSLINHYHSRFDIQSAAMFSCVLGRKTTLETIPKSRSADSWKKKSESNVNSGGSPYNTIHGLKVDNWDVSSAIRHNRSNSEGCLVEVARPASGLNIQEDGSDLTESKKDLSLLDPLKSNQFNDIRSSYADILCRWELLLQKATVNKYIYQPNLNEEIEFQFECRHCRRHCKDGQCHHCKKMLHTCAICRLSVRGSSIFCLICGHGGHTSHYLDWFNEFEVCPSGCGCSCLTQMQELFDPVKSKDMVRA